MVASLPEKEDARLEALRGYNILDTEPEENFDDLVRLAAFICGTPIAAVSLVDSHRQWFKSIFGLVATEAPRDIAFCAHAILRPDVTIVPDARTDPRFLDNPMVTGDPNIRFYAGAPLITDDGYALGTLCVVDNVPHDLTPDRAEALRTLARQVTSQIQANRRVAERERLLSEKECLVTERERAERALRDSHRALERSQMRLAEAQRIAQIGSWEYDIDTGQITWSDQLFRLFEMHPSEGEPGVEALMARYHPDDRERHYALTNQAIEDGEPYAFDVRILRRDSSVRWAHAVGRGERDTSGRVARLFGTLMDVHERKVMEESLREQAERLRQSEAALRAVLEGAPVILYAADAEGTVTLSEGSGLSALGLNYNETVGNSVFDFTGGNRLLEANTRRALAGEAVSFDVRVYKKYLHINLRPLHTPEGVPAGFIGVCFDVTERKQSEEKLRDHAIVLEFQNGELEKANAELEALATTDSLTGLRNHGAFQERLREEVERSVHCGRPLSLILLDVDRFKRYNDAHGHPAGDFVIKAVGKILQSCAREADLVARYGGEEFVIILPQTDLAGAATYAERVRASIETYPWPLRGITASFGVATLRKAVDNGADLIANADAALYQSKSAGRNRVTCLPGSLGAPQLVPKEL